MSSSISRLRPWRLPFRRSRENVAGVPLITGSSSSELTGRACSPYSTQWLEDTYTLSAGIVNGVFSSERRKWFFIAVDNAFGEAMVKDASQRLQQLGVMVVGTVRHPLNSPDLSSYLLQASSANADVIALADVGADTATAIKGGT